MAFLPFLPKAMDTLQSASGLARGIIVSTTLARLFNKVIYRRKSGA